MFYLLAQGGTSGQGHNNVQVLSPIGVNNAASLIWQSSADWTFNTDSFLKIRQSMINKAISLSHRDWAIQTADAWNAVGVCDHCTYTPGDANGNGIASGMDVTFMIAYLKGQVTPPITCDLDYEIPAPWTDFYVGMDWDGNCLANGLDVTYAVGYFKGQQPAILWCPHYTPGTP